MITTDHKKIARQLLRRGWEDQDISKAITVLKRSESKKLKSVKMLDIMMYWVILIAALFGNMIILGSMIPLLIIMPQEIILLALATIGLSFGFVIDDLFRNINMNAGHYILAGFLFPLIAGIFMFFILKAVRVVAMHIGLIVKADFLIITIFYVAAFSLPHIIHNIIWHVQV